MDQSAKKSVASLSAQKQQNNMIHQNAPYTGKLTNSFNLTPLKFGLDKSIALSIKSIAPSVVNSIQVPTVQSLYRSTSIADSLRRQTVPALLGSRQGLPVQSLTPQQIIASGSPQKPVLNSVFYQNPQQKPQVLQQKPQPQPQQKPQIPQTDKTESDIIDPSVDSIESKTEVTDQSDNESNIQKPKPQIKQNQPVQIQFAPQLYRPQFTPPNTQYYGHPGAYRQVPQLPQQVQQGQIRQSPQVVFRPQQYAPNFNHQIFGGNPYQNRQQYGPVQIVQGVGSQSFKKHFKQ